MFLTDKGVRQAVKTQNWDMLSSKNFTLTDVLRLSDIDTRGSEYFITSQDTSFFLDIKENLTLLNSILGEDKLNLFITDFINENPARDTNPYKNAFNFVDEILKKGYFNSSELVVEGLKFLHFKLDFVVNLFSRDISSRIKSKPRSRPVKSSDFLLQNNNIFRIIKTQYDLFDLITGNSGLTDNAPLPEKPAYYLIYLSKNGFVKDLKINESTLSFIDSCNGQRTLADIIKIFQNELDIYPSADNEEKFYKLCNQLIQNGIIVTSPAPGRFNES